MKSFSWCYILFVVFILFVSIGVQAEEPITKSWDIVVMMTTQIGTSDPTAYKEGTHIFTPKVNFKPKVFRAPIANLVCMFHRTDDGSVLRCWPNIISVEDAQRTDFTTSVAGIRCNGKPDDASDHIKYCKGQTPGTVAYEKTHEFSCIDISLFCIDHGGIESLTNGTDK